jgi:hypothetical protein
VGYLPVLQVDLLDYVVLATRAEQLVKIYELATVRDQILQVGEFAFKLAHHTGWKFKSLQNLTEEVDFGDFEAVDNKTLEFFVRNGNTAVFLIVVRILNIISRAFQIEVRQLWQLGSFNKINVSQEGIQGQVKVAQTFDGERGKSGDSVFL